MGSSAHVLFTFARELIDRLFKIDNFGANDYCVRACVWSELMLFKLPTRWSSWNHLPHDKTKFSLDDDMLNCHVVPLFFYFQSSCGVFTFSLFSLVFSIKVFYCAGSPEETKLVILSYGTRWLPPIYQNSCKMSKFQKVTAVVCLPVFRSYRC